MTAILAILENVLKCIRNVECIRKYTHDNDVTDLQRLLSLIIDDPIHNEMQAGIFKKSQIL